MRIAALLIIASLAAAQEQPPSAEEIGTVVAQARDIALQYTRTLPNFLCTQNVRRDIEKGNSWKQRDTLTIDVGFSAEGERYKLIAIDGAPTRKTLAHVGGWNSNGEFGSLLQAVFKPEAHADFHWERWADFRGRRTHVLSYRIAREHSNYTITTAGFLRKSSLRTGMTGEVYIDRETLRVMRLTAGDDGLPPGWSIRHSESALEYDYADVGGERFLLPARVELSIEAKDSRMRNRIEFSNYRRFSSDAAISFEKQ